MQWLANNWFLVSIVSLIVGMHLFGYGCHGRHNHKKKSDDNGKHD